MFGGYYTIASGLMTRQREMDVIGNNLVNSQTPGYRGERMITSAFEQELLTRQEKYNTGVLGAGKMATATTVGGVTSLFHSGETKPTGRPLDMAINGSGFFNIKGEDGNYLTRSGAFTLDENGTLVFPNMGAVLDENGAEIILESDDFTVDETGTIYDPAGEVLTKILISEPTDLKDMIMDGNGMFRMQDNATTAPSQTYTIEQGNLELSNVNLNEELTQLIESQRGFQSCSNALQTMDALNRKAASQLGSI